MNRGGYIFLAPALGILIFIFMLPATLLFVVSFWSVRNFRLRPDFTVAAWNHFVNEYGGLTLYTLLVGLAVGGLCPALGFCLAHAGGFKAGCHVCRSMLEVLINPFARCIGDI